jgi:hypothetical protein
MRASGTIGAGMGALMGAVLVVRVEALPPAEPVISRMLRWIGLGLALLLGTPDSSARADFRDDRAAAQLRGAGGKVTVGKDGRITGIVLFPDQSRVLDSDLACLDGLTGVRSIILQDNHLTDAGIVHLKKLPALESLWIGGTHTDASGKTQPGGMAFTDATLAHLGEIKSLKRLTLASTGFTDAGLVHLKGLPNLRSLGLSSPGFTDAGLVQITGLNSLEDLNLTESKITGRFLAALAVLPGLRSLSLGPNTFDADAIKPLADLAHLRTLMFYKAKLSPEALVSLERLKWLESLQFVETTITPARLAGLQTAMPKTAISYEEQERVFSALAK